MGSVVTAAACCGGARLGRLVDKEGSCERDAGAVGREAGDKADGQACKGLGGFQAWGGHGEGAFSGKAYLSVERLNLCSRVFFFQR